MSFLADKLKWRIAIKKAVQNPNDQGGFDISYDTITTIWANIKPLSDYVRSLRGSNTGEVDTHEFTIRSCAVSGLGREYASAFNGEFDEKADINPLKKDYFVYLKTETNNQGRLFSISGIKLDEENNEFVKISCREIEEQGTGYPQ